MLRPAPALLLCSLVVLPSSTVFAQTTPDAGTVFVGATGFAAIEKLPSSRGYGIEDDLSGTVAGGALALGMYLGPRLSARLEWGLTDTLTSSQSLGVNPLAAFQLGTALTAPVLADLSVVDSSIDRKRQTAVGALLVGYHVPAGRASIAVLGGIGFVNLDLQEAYDVRILRSSLPFPQPQYRTSTYHAVAVAGADVAVSLTEHASLVPSLRAFAVDGGLSLRPGVGVRWTF